MVISNKLKLVNIMMVIIAVVLLAKPFMPKDLNIKINPLIEEYNIAKEKYESMSYNIMMKDVILNRNKELINEINNINIDANLFQEEIMLFLYSHSKENNVEIEEIIFSEQSYVPNSDDGEGYTSVNTIDSAAVLINVNMNFKCSFDALLKFIDDIKNDNKYIAISSFNLLSWSEDIVCCAVELCFYSIPIIADGDFIEKR